MKTAYWTSTVLAMTLAAFVAEAPAPVWAMGPRTPQTAGQDMKNAGTETKDATKSVGHGVAKGTKTGYRKTKNGTKTAYHKTASGTKKAYHKTGEGIAKTGDKMEGKPAPQ